MAATGVLLALGALGLAGPDAASAAAAADCHATNAEELSFRKIYGFSTDPDVIHAVLADPYPNCDWGIPLTDAESAEINRRSGVAQEINGLNEYILHHSDVFGGLYIDNPAGGIVVLLTIATTPDANLAEAEGLIPGDVDYRVRTVKYSRRELVDLMPKILKAGNGAVNGTGLDEMNNRVDVSIDPARFDETRAALLAKFPDDMLSFESSDGGHDTIGQPPTDAAPSPALRNTFELAPWLSAAILGSALAYALRRRLRTR